MKDLLKPDVGISVGTWYLGQQLNQFGDPAKALTAYNQGPNSSAVNAGTSAYANSVLSKLQQPQNLPGIPASTGPSDDEIFSAFTGQSKAAPSQTDDDAIFKSFIKPEPTATAGNATPGSVTESRGPNGELVLDMGGVPSQQQKSPVVAAIEKLGQFGRGAYQGLTDLPAGLGQGAAHQSLQEMQAFDQLFGTHTADKFSQLAQQADQQAAQREADYQAATPNSTFAGVGRVAGNLAPAFIGGPAAAAAPLETISNGAGQLAARLGAGPGIQGMMRLGGASVGGALQGAAYGASAPVSSGVYGDQVANNAKFGAVTGGLLPVAGAAVNQAGRTIGGGLRALVDPFTSAGQQRVAANTLAQQAGGPVSADLSQLVPGSTPTLAEATQNAGIAKIQRTMRDLNPVPFVAQEEANAAARLGAYQDMAGDSSKLDFFRASRKATAANLYGKAIADYDPSQMTPWIKGQITQLLKRPSINAASKKAQELAIERGENPAPEGSLPALHDVKTALDDMIGHAASAGKGGEAKALEATKEKLLTVMEKLSPEYADARITYAEMSKPINQMEVLQGLNLTDAKGNITLAKVQTAIKGIQRRLATPGVDAAKSLEPHQLATLEAIRDDLLRSAKGMDAGISRGSPSAQNLATQNLLSQVLPGRIGALAAKAPAGTIGSAIGGGLGYLMGGPLTSAAGAAIGGSLGRTASGILNMQNEAIQGALQRMLLNAGEGAAALNRAPVLRAPVTQVGGLQRFLYPALTVGGADSISRPALPAR
jgi:hypothetical protein